ncbi:MAG: efflux RND transporter periplasmic adaptor subunit [Desulfovibrionaceae bacterium]
MKKYLLLALIVAVAAGGVYLWRSGGKSDAVRILRTEEVTRGTVRKVLEATGIVKAQVGAQVKIGARATGVLLNVPVKVGDEVRAGELVAEIDDRELVARVEESRARVRLAEAKAQRAAKELVRIRTLVEKGLDHQSNLDQAVEDERVTRFEAQAQHASLETLAVQLSYYSIYSPIDGVVSQVAAQEGETVVSGLQVSNLITVLDPTKLEMWIYVDETDVGRTRVGQGVEFTVDAYPDHVFSGGVDRLYPEPEIRDNIVYYRALVGVDYDADFPLRPEMTTQCRIVVEERADVLTAPNTALKWVGGTQVVFVLEADGSVREVRPELGLQGLDRSEVRIGLEEGDKVATQLVLPAGYGGSGGTPGSSPGGGPGGSPGGGPGGGQGGRG